MTTKIELMPFDASAYANAVNKSSAENLVLAANALDRGLHWSKTPEGPDFWCFVHSRLTLIADSLNNK